MSRCIVIGVDPGLTTGIARIDLDGASPEFAQLSPGLVVPFVEMLVGADNNDVVLAVEAFIVGYRASRSSTPKGGQIARELIGRLIDVPARYRSRSASEVKLWATDKRLDAAGLLAPTKGMPHARDAARHAIYAAVKDCGQPDPLSKTKNPRSVPIQGA